MILLVLIAVTEYNVFGLALVKLAVPDITDVSFVTGPSGDIV